MLHVPGLTLDADGAILSPPFVQFSIVLAGFTPGEDGFLVNSIGYMAARFLLGFLC